VPGIPQVYYVGLLAGGNDLDLLRRTGVGRDINRHYYTDDELTRDFERPVVQSLLDLLKLRDSHPAFGGAFSFIQSQRDRIELEWTHGAAFARLDVDLTRMQASLTCSESDGRKRGLAWQSAREAEV